MFDRISPMGCHRALMAMDLREVRARLSRAKLTANSTLRRSAKDAARRSLISLRELRLTIGADGYRLP